MDKVLKGKSVAFVGGGAMAGAMIGGLLNSQTVSAKAIAASDPHAERIKDLESRFGISTTTDNLAAARAADIVVLSVKPQMLRFVFLDLCGKLRKDALVLSIIAGARVDSIAKGLKHAAVVRSMPNTPAQVAEGMTVWTASASATAAQREEAQCASMLAAIESVADSVRVPVQAVLRGLRTGDVRLEAEGKDASGRAGHVTAEGKLEDIASYHRTITGTWTQGTTKGTFKLTRD